MHLEKLDLNLLVALDELLLEQSVTRAALKLSISQPAMSGALTRLRDHFGDPLISRVGHSMVLTPFAIDLAPGVRRLLANFREVARARPSFNPEVVIRRFTVVASDYAQAVFLPSVVNRVIAAAPGVSLDIEGRFQDHEERFARGLVDLFIVPSAMAMADHPSFSLFEDDYVVVAWKDHPTLGVEISTDEYLNMGHAIRSIRSMTGGFTGEEMKLLELGYQRKVMLTVPAFEMLPRMIVGTRLIAGMQKHLAELAAKQLPIRILRHPIAIPRLQLVMQWPSFRDHDAGGRWLRSMFIQAALDHAGTGH